MSLRGTRVLVTGGRGFVGGHTMRVLAESGARPVAFGRRASAGAIAGDVTDPEAVMSATADVDAVVHLAVSPGYRAEADARHDAAVNALGTLNVLQAARARALRVVYTSTSHVYGTSGVVSEEDPTRPTTLYGASKLAGESYCGVFNRSHGVATTILRFPVLFGVPASGPPPPNVVEVFTSRALANEPILLEGGGQVVVDLLDVQDAAASIALALAVPVAIGRTYNIGTGRALSLGELAAIVVREAVSRSPVRDGPPRAATPLPVLNTRRAVEELGFRPRVAPPDGVSGYVRQRRDAG